MLYSAQSRRSDNIIILGFELEKFLKFLLQEKPNQFLFTDKNAACDNVWFDPALKYALYGNIFYYNNQSDINFKNVFSWSWYNNDNIEQQMMAEVLVYERVPFDLVTDIYVQTHEIFEQVDTIFQDTGLELPSCFSGSVVPKEKNGKRFQTLGRWSYFFNTKIDFER